MNYQNLAPWILWCIETLNPSHWDSHQLQIMTTRPINCKNNRAALQIEMHKSTAMPQSEHGNGNHENMPYCYLSESLARQVFSQRSRNWQTHIQYATKYEQNTDRARRFHKRCARLSLLKNCRCPSVGCCGSSLMVGVCLILAAVNLPLNTRQQGYHRWCTLLSFSFLSC